MTDTLTKARPAQSLAAPRPDRRRILIGAGAFGLLLGAGASLQWWSAGRFMVGTDNAYVRADVVTIAPRISGYVAEAAVGDNQTVQQGQVLARIDDRDYRAKVDQTQAAVAAAEAEVAAKEARIADLAAQQSQARNLIAEASSTIEAGQAEARRADLEYRRQQVLIDQQVTSAQNLELAEAGARKAKAALSASQAALAARRDRLPALAGERQGALADLNKARAALKGARAALALAEIDLADTVIRAPVAGVVGQRSVRPGQYVEPGAPLLAVVPHRAYVVANYKETQVGPLRIGQPVKVKVDALDGAVLNGRVDSFAPASGAQFALLPPDNATGNFTKIVQRMPVRIRIDQDQARAGELRPGMSVVATIDTRGTSGHGR